MTDRQDVDVATAWRAIGPPTPWGFLTPQWQRYIQTFVEELVSTDSEPREAWDWTVRVSWDRRLDDEWRSALERLASEVRS